MAKKYTITEAAKKLKVTRTHRLAQLLRDARAKDSRHQARCHTLLENYSFADKICVYATLEDHQRWDIPRVISGRLFTRCG